ncbi:MAG TPA: hypothetical protein VFJ58_06720 [Armatimonadota bacterium]|nr:hypothetical protein [Armatimonadota bacterium]
MKVRNLALLLACAAALVQLAPAPASSTVPLTPVKAEPVGIGGAGALFNPAISPHDPRLLFVSCDMSGFYRSDNGGQSWSMEDGRQIQGSPSARVFFHPVDPAVVFQYGPRNGLQISRDRGVSWTPFVTEPPWGAAAVTAMVIDPGATSHILIGTENGLFRSRDAGKTWTKANGITGSVIGLFIDPTTSSAGRRCFAAIPGGVYRSDDGGDTWVESGVGLPWRGIRAFTAGASVKTGRVALYVTIPSRAVNGRFEGGVYRSTDGARTWESAMGEGINTALGKKDEYGIGDIAEYNFVDMAANNPDVVYTTTSGTGYWPPYHFTVFRTADGGRHWQYVFTGDPRFKNRNVQLGWITWDLNWGFGGPPIGFTVSRSDPDAALYTNVGVFSTTDAGKQWRQIYTAQAPGQGPEGPGQRWRSIGLEVTTNWNYYIDPHDPSLHAICYTDIGFARSTDGGKDWQWSAKGAPWDNTFYQLAIDPHVKGRVWAAASNQHDIPHWTQQEGAAHGAHLGGIVVSTDGMKTWRAAGTGLPDAPAVSVVLDPHSPPDRRRLWAPFWGSGVYRSDDGGATWVKKSEGLGYPGNLNSYRLQLQPDGALYCAVAARRQNGNHYPVAGGLWRSHDGGDTWECVTESLKPFGMMDFAIDPRDPKVIYLCQMPTPNGEIGGVYKTTDGGQTWRRLPLKVHSSANDPYVHAFAPILHPLNPDIVFVTTEGEGAWVSEDAGETWREFKAIPFMTPHRITFDPTNPSLIYMTTFGGGVWKVTLR